MKKAITFLLATTMIFSMAACGDSNSTITESTSSNETEEPENSLDSSSESEDSITIDQIDWNVEAGIIDGTSCLIFSYTNNTDFVITDVEMEFKQREDLTAEELSVFDDLKADRELTDEEVKEIYILGYNRKFADPGETVSQSPCVINGTYTLADSIEQYEVMEPSEVSIAYIGSDDKMYIMYYDFKTDTYSASTQGGQELKEWSDSEISSLIPEPDLKVVQVSSDDDDRFYFKAFGVSMDEFNNYIDACKESGFTDVQFEAEGKSYRASNPDGYEVNVTYSTVEEDMSVSLEKE